MIQKILLAVLMMVSISSCKKTTTTTEDLNIPGNIPPPDHTIDSSTILLYINKAYINIIGREPMGNERSSALGILRQDNFSVPHRQQFVETLFAKNEYNQNLFLHACSEYLASTDSFDVESVIFQYKYLLTQPQYAPFYSLIQNELNRLDTFKVTLNEMNAGKADYREMLRRCVNNYFYDQVNMGTENFVVSTYQNFLFRFPDSTELSRGKIMVDGISTTTVFFRLGKSKSDYINIFFDSPDFYEGQVRYVFKRFLFREPSPAEMVYYSNVYKSNNSFKAMEKEIFSLNEYAGID